MAPDYFYMTLNIYLQYQKQGSASFGKTSRYQASFRYNGAKTYPFYESIMWNQGERGVGVGSGLYSTHNS